MSTHQIGASEGQEINGVLVQIRLTVGQKDLPNPSCGYFPSSKCIIGMY